MLSKSRFTVDTDTVLGRGSFGTVNPATDEDGSQVAAKRIDAKDNTKLAQAAEDLRRLVSLNHENIARVFEVLYEGKTTLWVFMELCEYGDLVDYLKRCVELNNNGVSDREKLKLMLDISKGVEYLHSRNIVHRDIKPSNILVSGVPATAKLTDFDLSKFFDDHITTSLMTTTVGTAAFKAPEFYQRSPDGKINYHRNVDIFAMGLTFLGMIQDNPALCLKIETPNEASELFMPAGQLMWERNNYGKEPLAVVGVKEATKLWDKVREIIGEMTCFQPTSRILASQVVESVSDIRETYFPVPTHIASDSDVQMRPQAVRDLVSTQRDLDIFGLHLGLFQAEIDRARVLHVGRVKDAACWVASHWWRRSSLSWLVKKQVRLAPPKKRNCSTTKKIIQRSMESTPARPPR